MIARNLLTAFAQNFKSLTRAQSQNISRYKFDDLVRRNKRLDLTKIVQISLVGADQEFEIKDGLRNILHLGQEDKDPHFFEKAGTGAQRHVTHFEKMI